MSIHVFPQFNKGGDSIASQRLDEVVVTATRTVRQLSSLPMPVTLIAREQIEKIGVTRLNEILNEQTGIVMTPDATIGGGEGVQIQGIAADYIMVLIDGVPVVGRSSGNLDLSRIAVGNIKQVEIVKGPSSSLFGSEALGGVINIITDKPTKDTFSGQLSHRVATFNNQNTSFSLNQRKQQFGYALFLDRLSTDGYDLSPEQEGQTISPFYNYTLSGRLFYEPSEAWSLFLSTRYFDQEFDLSSGNSEERDQNAHFRADHKPSANSMFQYELYYTLYQTEEQTVNPENGNILFDNDFRQQLLRPEIRYHLKAATGNTLTLGSGMNLEMLDRSLFREAVQFNSQYLFAQYDLSPVDAFNMIAGVRYDRHSEYQSQLSPKLSLRYQLSPALALKASMGSGFKAPDFRQLYLDFSNVAGGGYTVFGKEVEEQGLERLQSTGEIASLQVDASTLGEPLKAESSVGLNFGFAFKKGKITSEMNLFRNNFRNLIDTRILATKSNGQNVFGYINRERVFTQGLELDISYRILEDLTIAAGYQLLYAYDNARLDAVTNGEVFARDPFSLQTIRLERDDYFGLENRSRHSLNAKVFYEFRPWKTNANLRVIYRSRFGLTDRNGNGILDTYDTTYIPGYALINLSFGKTFYERYQLQLGANNLLDFRGANPLAAQNSELLVNPGIQLFAKLNLQF